MILDVLRTLLNKLNLKRDRKEKQPGSISIEKVVNKVVNEYGETLQLLGKE